MLKKKNLKQKIRNAWKWVKKNKTFCLCYTGLGLIATAQVLPHDALAWSTPSSGSFAYDVYDIAIKKIAQGPIGFVAGSACLGGALFTASRSAWVPAGILAVSSGVLYKLDTIATSLGFLI